MARAFHVDGPSNLLIQQGVNGTGLTLAADGFGQTDNDDLISVEIRDFMEELQCQDEGRVPGQLVFTGRIAIITGTLVKWDALTVFDDLAASHIHLFIGPGALDDDAGDPTIGDAGVIGTLMLDDAAFTTVIEPRTTGKYRYIFPRCYLPEDGLRMFDWGNIDRKLGVRLIALPYPSADGATPGVGGTLFTREVIS